MAVKRGRTRTLLMKQNILRQKNIFDISAGTVIFHSESTVDVLPLAKKALGIPASKTTPYVPASAQQQNGAQN